MGGNSYQMTSSPVTVSLISYLSWIRKRLKLPKSMRFTICDVIELCGNIFPAHAPHPPYVEVFICEGIAAKVVWFPWNELQDGKLDFIWKHLKHCSSSISKHYKGEIIFYFSLFDILLGCMCCIFFTFDRKEGSGCEHGKHSVMSKCLWDPARDKKRTCCLRRMAGWMGNSANPSYFWLFFFSCFQITFKS